MALASARTVTAADTPKAGAAAGRAAHPTRAHKPVTEPSWPLLPRDVAGQRENRDPGRHAEGGPACGAGRPRHRRDGKERACHQEQAVEQETRAELHD